MHEHTGRPLTVEGAAHLPSGERSASAGKGMPRRVWTAVTGAVGAVMGILPHVLHHAGPLAGAAIVAGATGTVVFGLLGLLLSVPLLLRLYRRFGTWRAPAVAVTVFAMAFTVSTVWVGPAIRGAGESPAAQPAGHVVHHSP
jgi:hypothetical protein